MTTPTLHRRSTDLSTRDHQARTSGTGTGLAGLALDGLRLALGFQFLWAFLDKSFGLGYATPSARAWINGGSPTGGFLSGVSAGPLQGTFNAMAGHAFYDWLFMAGLLGIGAALLLGVALRIAATSGVLLLTMMYLAAWPLAKTGNAGPTGSNNPIVEAHLISALALIVVATITARASFLGRAWADLPTVRRRPWLR